MEGRGDIPLKVSPARLWFKENLWSSVEEGEKLEGDTKVWCLHSDSENWRTKIPFVIIYNAKVPSGERSGPQGDGYCVTQEQDLQFT